MVKRAAQGDMNPSCIKAACLGSVPKALITAREALGDSPKIDGAALKSALTSTQFRAVTDAFRNAMKGSPAMQADYGSAATNVQRRNMIASFVLDPDMCKAKGCNRTIVENKELDQVCGAWLMESQIGGPEHLNNPEAAKILCESGELPVRDHEYESLNAAGIKQYWFTKAHLLKSTGRVETAEASLDIDLAKDEYQSVVDKMAEMPSSAPSVVAKRRGGTSKPARIETEQEKELKTAITCKATNLRKLKHSYEQARTQINVSKDLLPNITARGFTREMVTFFAQQLDAGLASVTKASQIYASEIIADAPVTLEQCKTSDNNIKDASGELKKCFAALKKGAIMDIKKLQASTAAGA